MISPSALRSLRLIRVNCKRHVRSMPQLGARPGRADRHDDPKNRISGRWALRGTRPSPPKDQRTASAYIFGAICPARGEGRPGSARLHQLGMSLHLKEIAQVVAPDAHAVVLLDQASTCPRARSSALLAIVPLPGPFGRLLTGSEGVSNGPSDHPDENTCPSQGADSEPS
jgi:hypothetical protein